MALAAVGDAAAVEPVLRLQRPLLLQLPLHLLRLLLLQLRLYLLQLLFQPQRPLHLNERASLLCRQATPHTYHSLW